MDRRTGLAFVLIFLILAASQYLMPKFFPAPPRPEMADSTQVVENRNPVPEAPREEKETSKPMPAATNTEALSSADQALLLKPGNGEKTITVTTPLYRAIISSIGGRIVSFETLKHRGRDGGPAQLVPSDIPAQGLDAIIFRTGDLDLGQAAFRFQRGGDFQLDAGSGPRSVDLTVETQGGLAIHKIITFHPDSYGLDVDYTLNSTDEALARQSLNLLGNPEAVRFGWNEGINLTERIERLELPAMRSVALVGDQLSIKKRQKMNKSVEKVEGVFRGSVHFAGVQNKYFTIFGIVPQEEGQPVEGTIRLGGDKELMAQSWAIEVPALKGQGSEIATARLQMFIGPADQELVHVYGQNIEKGIDLGMKIIRPLANLVLSLMSWLHKFIPNYGIIIILFSVATKLAFYPLSKAQTQSMKRMQEIQPKIKALQEKYKDDKDKLNQATMKLYQEEKVNPLAGCLPMLVQMPVFFALYRALSHTIALRGQPFVAWITDLSAPDALFQLPFALPILGTDFNVLPILMAVAMFYQTKLTPSSGGGQMAAMNTMMPLIMVFIFYNMPSGLVLYWLVNTIMQVYQTWKIHSTMAVDQGAQTA